MYDAIGLVYAIGLWLTLAFACIVHKDDYCKDGWLISVSAPVWPISWLVFLSISINLFMYKKFGYVGLIKTFFKPSELVYVDSSTEETEK